MRLLPAAVLAWTITTLACDPHGAGGQAPQTPGFVAPPVTPVPSTVDPNRSDPPPTRRAVPEGEPGPTGVPPAPQPIADPVIQTRERPTGPGHRDEPATPGR